MHENNDGRAGRGSEGLLTALQEAAGRLGLAQDARTGQGALCESPDPAALAVGRLSAAADDAEELAAGMAADAVLWIRTVQGWHVDLGLEDGPFSPVVKMLDRVKLHARLAVRLARQAEALRQSAADVQTATDVPAGLCWTCGERPAQQATGPACCWPCFSRAGGRL